MELHAACGSVTVVGCSSCSAGICSCSRRARVKSLLSILDSGSVQKYLNDIIGQTNITRETRNHNFLRAAFAPPNNNCDLFLPYSPAVRCGLYTVQCVQHCTGAGGAAAETRGSCPVSSGLTVRHCGHGAVTPRQRYKSQRYKSQRYKSHVTRHTSHVTRHTRGG